MDNHLNKTIILSWQEIQFRFVSVEKRDVVCLKMATDKDLANAVRDSLEAVGELSQTKAEMRNKIMKLLDGSSKSHRTIRPQPSFDIVILNELIRQYLDWIGYKYTLSVFISECELGKQPLDRSRLTQDLGIKENESTAELPLLYSIIETFKNIKKNEKK